MDKEINNIPEQDDSMMENSLIQADKHNNDNSTLLENVLMQGENNNPNPNLETIIVQNERNIGKISESLKELKPTIEKFGTTAEFVLGFLESLKGDPGEVDYDKVREIVREEIKNLNK